MATLSQVRLNRSRTGSLSSLRIARMTLVLSQLLVLLVSQLRRLSPARRGISGGRPISAARRVVSPLL
jgi:hypothetical protein